MKFFLSSLIFVTLFSCDSKKSTVEQENVRDTLASVIEPKSDTESVEKNDSSTQKQVNEEPPKKIPINIEGTIVSEYMYDGTNSLEISIINSSIKDSQKTIKLPKSLVVYFQTNFNDRYAIDCKGNFQFSGDETNNGKKVKGTICESLGEFENKEDGSMFKQKIYRPIELNYMD